MRARVALCVDLSRQKCRAASLLPYRDHGIAASSTLARDLLLYLVVKDSGIYPAPKVRTWFLRTGYGEVRQVHSLAHMAMLLREGRLDPRDEISAGDGVWTPLEDVVETHGLAETLDALGHLDPQVTRRRSA